MSSSHERVRVTEQLQTSSPEVPQRPARGPIPPIPVAAQPHHSRPAVREIHKNAWLRRVSSNEKKGTPFNRKCDKLWVVFCVHDDVEAFLEFYPDPKTGVTHKPTAHISLNKCQHVSSSIVGQDNEYQFAVTLPNDVIRLYASNWDQMMEWVESLQGKLREMNILSPKDNLYSKLPESRVNPNNFSAANYPLSFGHISTRDPNSPLPPPPPNGFGPPLALSTEPSRQQPPPPPNPPVGRSLDLSSDYVEPSDRQLRSRDRDGENRRGCIFSSNFSTTPIPGTSTSDPTSSGSGASDGVTATFYVKPSSCPRDGSGSDSGNGSGGSIISLEPRSIGAHSSSPLPLRRQEVTADLISLSPSVAVVVGNSNTTVVQFGGCDESNLLTTTNSACASATTPVLIPELSPTPEPIPSTSSSATTSTSANVNSIPVVYSVVNKQKQSTSRSAKPNATTITTNGHNKSAASSTSSTSASKSPGQSSNLKLTNGKSSSAASGHNGLERQLPSLAPTTTTDQSRLIDCSISSENIYEHLFETITSSTPAVKSQPNSKVPSDTEAGSPPPLIPKRNPVPKRLQKVNNNSNRSSSLGRLEEGNSGGTGSGRSRDDGGRGNDCSSGNNRNRAHRQDVIRQLSTGNGNPSEDSAQQLSVMEGRPMEAMIGVRSGEYRIRREELPGVSQGQGDPQSGSGASSSNSASTNIGNSSTQIPLKEQQVLRLKTEINHSAGVRVVLRKKDCVGSIAFIDYLGAVWIGGWKQQEHPVLYYAFHVGDQVLKVAGVTVQNSVEAYRAIKMISSMQVEFILRRLPYGRVFVLKRSREAEPLGLVAIGNSGEIGEVIPSGLAANQGLPPKSPATDGKTNCNWFLTEINNRPLSLLARDNEVRDRLNAVGKEISILVQPADLVKHLRKNLKSVRGFKDYLIV